MLKNIENSQKHIDRVGVDGLRIFLCTLSLLIVHPTAFATAPRPLEETHTVTITSSGDFRSAEDSQNTSSCPSPKVMSDLEKMLGKNLKSYTKNKKYQSSSLIVSCNNSNLPFGVKCLDCNRTKGNIVISKLDLNCTHVYDQGFPANPLLAGALKIAAAGKGITPESFYQQMQAKVEGLHGGPFTHENLDKMIAKFAEQGLEYIIAEAYFNTTTLQEKIPNDGDTICDKDPLFAPKNDTTIETEEKGFVVIMKSGDMYLFNGPTISRLIKHGKRE